MAALFQTIAKDDAKFLSLIKSVTDPHGADGIPPEDADDLDMPQESR
ncbi:MAG TPA: hypothetical protein PLI07_01035 [Candidatus Hydrogenedentes bacterium]|nr:hypothetical protein [Candidatus Hydrogenedentota bacterium]HPC16857.1 hypothetical protein [Candidatus Hydrogenedentota bacterium]